MIDDQMSPEEQRLAQQIQIIPKPKLDPVARDAIRQLMISQFRAVTLAAQSQPRSVRPRFSIPRRVLWVAAAMVVVAIGAIIVQIGSQNTHPVVEPSTITVSPDSQVAMIPSETFTPTPDRATMTATVTLESVPGGTVATAPAGLMTPSTPSAPTATQEMIIVVEGPVTSITDNMVTIYGLSIEVEPQHPILQMINVGDVVRVQGALDSGGVVIAGIVSNLPNSPPVNGGMATVGLDGPVEAINGNTIIVNSIPVQLAPNDPVLQTVQVGSFVSVQGNFQTSGSTIVLVVVNIAVINNTTTPSNCWYHVDAMGMGHWHCDGMGMGMGEPDGMGMGDDDGMGMGG